MRVPSRIRSWLVGTSTPASAGYGSWDQANAAIADVTRWGWLPALSGVSVAAAHAERAHRDASAAAEE
jgi:hypothetical protein